MEDDNVINPPNELTVYAGDEPRVVLWLPDGRALVRQIGFTAGTCLEDFDEKRHSNS